MKYNEGFQDLSTKQKIDHIWTYYRAYILAAVFVLVLVVITAVQFTAPKSQLDILMINSDAQDSAARGFEEFFTAYGYDYYDGAVSLNASLGFFTEKQLAAMDEPAAGQQENMEKELMLSAWLAGGETELFFGTGDQFFFFAAQGMLADLRTILSEDLLMRYADQLDYDTDEGRQTEGYPCAIALSGNPWLTENGYYSKECYVGVLDLSDNKDIAADFLEYLLTRE